MKVRFENIHIENFMSLGVADINLDNTGYTLVYGINNNPADLAKSNGSGKSSIFDAIMWALTGETIRGNKDVVNIHGTDGALVDIQFTVDNNLIRLVRAKNHSAYKTNLKIFINSEDKSGKGIRDTEQLLKEYIPELTHSLLSSVVILGQGLPERFTNNSPSGRKEVLERLCRSDFMIEELKVRIAKRKDELNSEIRDLEDSALVITTKCDLDKQTLAKNKLELATLMESADFGEQAEILNDRLTELKQQLVVANEQKRELTSARNSLSEALQKVLTEKQVAIDAVNQEKEAALEPLVSAQSDARVELEVIKSNLRAAQSIVDVCPTCGQTLVGVEKPDTAPLQAELDEAQAKFNSITADLSAQRQLYDNRAAEVRAVYDTQQRTQQEELNSVTSNLQYAESTASLIERNIDKVTQDLNELLVHESNFAMNVQRLEDSITELQQQITVSDEELLYKYKQRDELQIRQGIVSKFSTIVSREFRGFLLSSIITFIDKKAKMYCKDVFDTELISFELDGNNISIKYDNKEYESLSGGEKQKVDLIIQFSIRDMLCAYTDFSTNLVVLDEIFDNLDETGCSKIIELISNKLTDISSIFIITHHGNELNIPYDNELVVVKGADGVSYLQ